MKDFASANLFADEMNYYDQLHQEKYRDKGQSKAEHCRTTAKNLASNGLHANNIYSALINNRFIPAGRVQAALGATEREVSPFNCSVSQRIDDSMDSIMDALGNAARILRLGTGIGYNFSNLRPRGAEIKKLKTESSGPLSFMRMFDVMASTIASSGHRRGAQMGIMNVTHPDIEAFIDAKMQKDAYRQFNLSVGITDAFMAAVEKDQEWSLSFNSRVYKIIKAKELWEKITKNAYYSAEPGIIFIDRLNSHNNLHYCENIEATNPCCVSGTTVILTKVGYTPIEECVGQNIEIWNGQAWSQVKPFYSGLDKLFLVTLSNGQEIQCTSNHKFIDAKGEFVELKELQRGSKLSTFEMPIMDCGEDYNNDYTQGVFSAEGGIHTSQGPMIWLYGEKQELVDAINCRRATVTYGRIDLFLDEMLPKTFVPGPAWSIKSRLDWFAGLADGDGTLSWNHNSNNSSCELQITSIDKDFLQRTSMMLNTLGIQPIINIMHLKNNRLLPDGKGGQKEYLCQDCWRLRVKPSDLKELQELGFFPLRLNIDNNEPQYSVKRRLSIIDIQQLTENKTYCFTEPNTHRGTFNGIVTGQSEQPLPPYGLCLLGSFNLVAYIYPTSEGRFAFNYSTFIEDIRTFVEAYDNIFDKSIYAIPQHKEEAINKRRIGLGLTGIANAIELMNGRASYGESDFCCDLEYIAEILTEEAYRASVELAKSRGAFALFDNRYLQSKFINQLPDDIQTGINNHGIRNSHLISYAPCGTISQCAGNTSSGVEPVFFAQQDRKVHMRDGQINVTLNDYNMRHYGFTGKTLENCKVQDHLAVAQIIQKYTDSAVSKTVNVSSNCSYEDYSKIYLEAYKIGLKGITVYRPSELRGSVISEAKPVKTFADAHCVNGQCSM